MRVETLINRECGKKIKLVAIDCSNPGERKLNIEVFAILIDNDLTRDKLVTSQDSRPIPKGMSVEEYKKSELRGLFCHISYAEYFKICKKLEQAIAAS
jgi:hypothetical protein